MAPYRIIYYECVNPACRLRFPDLLDGLERERCPVCRMLIHPTQVVDPHDYEEDGTPAIKGLPILNGLLDNVRSGFNVGSIIRTADGVGLSKLYLGGITPTPDNPKVIKTALGAEKSIECERINNGVEKVRQLKNEGYSVWGLESNPEKDSLYLLGGRLPSRPLVLVVGNEICGIDPEILAQCDRIVFIPMVGRKRSYNVAIAFGIAASFLRYCQTLSHGSTSKFPST